MGLKSSVMRSFAVGVFILGGGLMATSASATTMTLPIINTSAVIDVDSGGDAGSGWASDFGGLNLPHGNLAMKIDFYIPDVGSDAFNDAFQGTGPFAVNLVLNGLISGQNESLTIKQTFADSAAALVSLVNGASGYQATISGSLFSGIFSDAFLQLPGGSLLQGEQPGVPGTEGAGDGQITGGTAYLVFDSDGPGINSGQLDDRVFSGEGGDGALTFTSVPAPGILSLFVGGLFLIGMGALSNRRYRGRSSRVAA